MAVEWKHKTCHVTQIDCFRKYFWSQVRFKHQYSYNIKYTIYQYGRMWRLFGLYCKFNVHVCMSVWVCVSVCMCVCVWPILHATKWTWNQRCGTLLHVPVCGSSTDNIPAWKCTIAFCFITNTNVLHYNHYTLCKNKVNGTHLISIWVSVYSLKLSKYKLCKSPAVL